MTDAPQTDVPQAGITQTDAPKKDIIRPTDDEARLLARGLLASARFGALAIRDPETGFPHVTRVAVGMQEDGAPLLLISTLAHHTRALLQDPVCALLVGEPGDKGDPLNHPRVSLQARAVEIDKAPVRAAWLASHPKTTLYFDFPDFKMFRLDITLAHMNGGFAKAYHLTGADFRITPASKD